MKETADSFCKGAKLTPDEYWKYIEKELTKIISMSKIKSKFKNDYCAEHKLDQNSSLEFDYQKMMAAYADYRNNLYELHKGEVTYYN